MVQVTMDQVAIRQVSSGLQYLLHKDEELSLALR